MFGKIRNRSRRLWVANIGSTGRKGRDSFASVSSSSGWLQTHVFQASSLFSIRLNLMKGRITSVDIASMDATT